MKAKYDRSAVMIDAWKRFKAQDISFGEAIRNASDNWKLENMDFSFSDAPIRKWQPKTEAEKYDGYVAGRVEYCRINKVA